MNKKILIGVITTLILIVVVYFLAVKKTDDKISPDANKTKTEHENIDFVKQGSLDFIKSGDDKIIKSIDIEVAQDEYSREKGLMYRRSMEENQGMLFIFQDASPRYFWMKNTYISLDIIYVGKDNKIVSVQKSAVPLSEESLPSYKDAMYVVEVNAGFVDKYNIKEGDFISFKI